MTERDRKMLEYYQQLHGATPTLLSLLAPVWWRYALGLILVIAAAVLLVGDSWLSFLVVGIVLGVILRDLMRYQVLAKSWPLMEKVFDWDQVNTLLASSGEQGKPS